MRIDVLQSEADLADALAAELAARHLSERFFYWSPLSVQAWLELTRSREYQNALRSRRLVAAAAPDLAAAIAGAGAAACEVVGLGPGDGEQDLTLLAALRAAGRDPRYLAVDCSQGLLERAVGAALAAGFPARGVKADLDAHLADLGWSDDRPPRLVTILGNTLAAFDPPAFLARLRPHLGADDRLLADVQVIAGANLRTTAAEYDNPDNRRFAWAPLRALGLTEQDGRVVFEWLPDAGGVRRLGKHFVAARDLTLAVGGRAVTLAAGERIAMSPSGKLAPGGLARAAAGAGYRVALERATEDGRFCLALLAPV